MFILYITITQKFSQRQSAAKCTVYTAYNATVVSCQIYTAYNTNVLYTPPTMLCIHCLQCCMLPNVLYTPPTMLSQRQPAAKRYCIHCIQRTECSLFYTALLQKRPIIWRSLLIVATPLEFAQHSQYGVATISRLLQIIGLFCKRAV